MNLRDLIFGGSRPPVGVMRDSHTRKKGPGRVHKDGPGKARHGERSGLMRSRRIRIKHVVPVEERKAAR